jgi:hypothetical protein
MAHLDDMSGADDARPLDTLDDAAAALSEQLGDEGDGGVVQGDDLDDEDHDPLDDADQGDDADEQDDEQDDEPVKPAIEPPASLNAEEKAAFAQLPPEAQRMLSAVETRRNGQVQEATTRAAEAQRSAQADAARQAAEAKQLYAEQARVLLDAYAPQQPNPADYGDNMQAYQRDHANWQYAAAQHQSVMQQVNAIGDQAQQALGDQDQQSLQADARALHQAFPEWFDEAKAPEHKTKLTAIGAALGYTDDLMKQAGSTDILALRTASGWKDKADKWDALQARRMAGVRAGKTAKPGTAQSQGSVRAQRTSDATKRLRSTGSLDDAAAAIGGLLNRR